MNVILVISGLIALMLLIYLVYVLFKGDEL
ncbi:potassium-transporting ATPase subunit F [Acetobacterium bakii]|uniref:K+-transporting ATPase, F subunit n=1 Tax=Acetobacterium bakii TaxID=52689 RepID=A0A0L6U4U8_9FIRM|nr:potassium-transporting ATPase subunit F [Acetobacterium bakii]KNZ43533.1 K+-transporting ATPase, F subunit [Acetobacterium bakii]